MLVNSIPTVLNGAYPNSKGVKDFSLRNFEWLKFQNVIGKEIHLPTLSVQMFNLLKVSLIKSNEIYFLVDIEFRHDQYSYNTISDGEIRIFKIVKKIKGANINILTSNSISSSLGSSSSSNLIHSACFTAS